MSPRRVYLGLCCVWTNFFHVDKLVCMWTQTLTSHSMCRLKKNVALVKFSQHMLSLSNFICKRAPTSSFKVRMFKAGNWANLSPWGFLSLSSLNKRMDASQGTQESGDIYILHSVNSYTSAFASGIIWPEYLHQESHPHPLSKTVHQKEECFQNVAW
jgi:hypothetical protein